MFKVGAAWPVEPNLNSDIVPAVSMTFTPILSLSQNTLVSMSWLSAFALQIILRYALTTLYVCMYLVFLFSIIHFLQTLLLSCGWFYRLYSLNICFRFLLANWLYKFIYLAPSISFQFMITLGMEDCDLSHLNFSLWPSFWRLIILKCTNKYLNLNWVRVISWFTMMSLSNYCFESKRKHIRLYNKKDPVS